MHSTCLFERLLDVEGDEKFIVQYETPLADKHAVRRGQGLVSPMELSLVLRIKRDSI